MWWVDQTLKRCFGDNSRHEEESIKAGRACKNGAADGFLDPETLLMLTSVTILADVCGAMHWHDAFEREPVVHQREDALGGSD